MNPGYIAIWIITSAIILLSTGWKPLIAPAISRRAFIRLVVSVTILLPFPLWHPIMPQLINLHLHASVYVLLFAGGIVLLRNDEELSYRSYLILCILFISLIWGTLRKIYSVDPMFYWLEPSWDAPLLAGALGGAFTARTELQFGLLVWGAAFGELWYSLLQGGAYSGKVGSVSWWDGLCLAIAAAFIFSQLLLLTRIVWFRIISYCNKWLTENRG